MIFLRDAALARWPGEDQLINMTCAFQSEVNNRLILTRVADVDGPDLRGSEAAVQSITDTRFFTPLLDQMGQSPLEIQSKTDH